MHTHLPSAESFRNTFWTSHRPKSQSMQFGFYKTKLNLVKCSLWCQRLLLRSVVEMPVLEVVWLRMTCLSFGVAMWQAPTVGCGEVSLPGALEQMQPQFISRFLEGQSGVTIKSVSCGDLFTTCVTGIHKHGKKSGFTVKNIRLKRISTSNCVGKHLSIRTRLDDALFFPHYNEKSFLQSLYIVDKNWNETINPTARHSTKNMLSQFICFALTVSYRWQINISFLSGEYTVFV